MPHQNSPYFGYVHIEPLGSQHIPCLLALWRKPIPDQVPEAHSFIAKWWSFLLRLEHLWLHCLAGCSFGSCLDHGGFGVAQGRYRETTAVVWGHTHHKHIKFLLMYVRGPVNTCWLGVLLVLQGALLGQEAPTSFWSCGYPHMPPPTTQIQTWVLITLHNQSMYTYNMRLPTNLPANHPHDDPKSQSILVCWPFLGFSVLFQNAPPTISCAPIPFGG